MLNVAVIGLGYFSQFHLKAWQANPDARIAGVADLVRAIEDTGALVTGIAQRPHGDVNVG